MMTNSFNIFYTISFEYVNDPGTKENLLLLQAIEPKKMKWIQSKLNMSSRNRFDFHENFIVFFEKDEQKPYEKTNLSVIWTDFNESSCKDQEWT